MKKTALFLFLSLAFWVTGAKAVEAVAYLTVNPTSGNYNINDTFTVTLGVNSGGESVGGIDGIAVYDSSKLELTSAVQSSDMVFANVDGGGYCSIKKEAGTVSYSCAANDTIGDKAVNGSLVTLTFKATNTGTANLSYTCSSATTDSNIIGSSSIVDIITCSSNQSGSYVIGNSTSSTTTSTPTPTTASTTTTTTTTTVLPKTGNTGVTVGLIAFGLVSLVSAAFFKFL